MFTCSKRHRGWLEAQGDDSGKGTGSRNFTGFLSAQIYAGYGFNGSHMLVLTRSAQHVTVDGFNSTFYTGEMKNPVKDSIESTSTSSRKSVDLVIFYCPLASCFL